MPAIPSLGRVEAALQRWLERPFLRRASVDLPLLKTSLKRAMVDELKPVAPSRFLLVVPQARPAELESHREEWEQQLTQYYLEVARQNGWSVVTPPAVEIVADPDQSGSWVRVAVDEDYLVYRGAALRHPRWQRGNLIPLLASSAAMIACLYLAILLVVPGAMPSWARFPQLPSGQPSSPAPAPQPTPAPRVAFWDSASKAVGDGFQAMSRGVGDTIPHRVSAVVSPSPGLAVRAGSPSREGATLDGPNGRLPQGSTLQWWSFQVVHGESIGGEDRWVRIGLAGPEWGSDTGKVLYVWMGGLETQGE